MAQERTLDVAELIEGKLARPSDRDRAAALHPDVARRLRHADAVVRRARDPARMGREPRRIRHRAERASLRLSGRRDVPVASSATGWGGRISSSPVSLSSASSPSAPASPARQPELFIWRFGAGIGLGGAIPTGIALAAEYMPHKIRATMIGLMFVGLQSWRGLGRVHRGRSDRDLWLAIGVLHRRRSRPFPMILVLAIVLPESIRFLIVSGATTAECRRHRAQAASDGSISRRHALLVERREPDQVRREPASAKAARTVTILLWTAFILSFTGHYFITGWMPTVLTDNGFSDAEANNAMGLFQMGGAIGSLIVAVALDWLGIRVVALDLHARRCPSWSRSVWTWDYLDAAGEHADRGHCGARRPDRLERALRHDLSRPICARWARAGRSASDASARPRDRSSAAICSRWACSGRSCSS